MLKLLAAAALASTSPVVMAAPDVPPPSIRVAVSDLDLRSDPGTRRLDQRLKTAVRALCPVPTSHDVIAHRDYRACLSEATQSADHGRALALSRRAGRTELAATAH